MVEPLSLIFRVFSSYQNLGTSGYTTKDMSRDVRKPDFCICQNEAADQLCGNRTTDQCLCFR